MKLADYSQDEQNTMPYGELCSLRRTAYEEFASTMTVRSEVDEWARRMEFRHLNSGEYEVWCDRNQIVGNDADKAQWSKTVGIWANRVSMVVALLIVRYGEAIDNWPNKFTDLDVARCHKWLVEGKIPGSVISAIKRGV